MARHPSKTPTEAELEILKVLWTEGPATVRQVHDSLGAGRSTGYTTTLKQLQIMAEKGHVVRDQKQRSHIYRSRLSESRVLGGIAKEMLNRAFGGSAQKLVMHALSVKPSSPEERAEIRALLDKLEKRAEDHLQDRA